MTVVQVVALLVVAGLGGAVALTRDPARQAVVAGVFGLALAVLFMAFQAPDVALSQVAVTAVAVPAAVLFALSKAREDESG